MAVRRTLSGKMPAANTADADAPATPDMPTREGPTPAGARLTGMGVSPGVSMGRAYILDRGALHVPQRHMDPSELPGEEARLHAAIAQSVTQLQELEGRVHAPDSAHEQNAILQAYVLMLRDPELLADTIRLIHAEKINAEWALRRAGSAVKQVMEGHADEYFRERGHDVDFVVERVLRNMLGCSPDLSPESIPEDAVVVAHDLSPADMMVLVRRRLQGIVTEVGGPTSHTAIVARAMCIPAVVAVPGVTELVGEAETLVVDGTRGEVLPNPSRMVLARYRGIRRQQEQAREELATLRESPAITLDGHTMRLSANIELDEEVPAALDAGAEGVGLYRTEYLFLHHRRVPTVEEQRVSYASVARALDGRRAVIRTYDLGGDKVLPGHDIVDGRNSALGLRAVRLAFKEPQLMFAQMEGILRASTEGALAIMLPMVGSVEELRQARAMLEETKTRLRKADVPFAPDIPLGLMIELPSAVWVADHLARECDFFSVGTNDLIQYTLAVDRQDSSVAHLYAPLHPAILRALHHAAGAAHKAGIPISMCGEMAAEPAYAGILLGLGLNELSMPAMAIPRVKHAIRHWRLKDAKALVADALNCATVADVQQLLVESQPEVDMHPGALRPTIAAPSA